MIMYCLAITSPKMPHRETLPILYFCSTFLGNYLKDLMFLQCFALDVLCCSKWQGRLEHDHSNVPVQAHAIDECVLNLLFAVSRVIER